MEWYTELSKEKGKYNNNKISLTTGADPAIGGPGGRLPLTAWLCAIAV